MVLLATLAVVELIVVIVIAAVLFMFGTTTSVAVGTGMLLVSLLAGVIALRAARPRSGVE
jgi:hypothetical protein